MTMQKGGLSGDSSGLKYPEATQRSYSATSDSPGTYCAASSGGSPARSPVVVTRRVYGRARHSLEREMPGPSVRASHASRSGVALPHTVLDRRHLQVLVELHGDARAVGLRHVRLVRSVAGI